jgi:hypothetical protein
VPFLGPGLHDLAASRGATVQTGQRPPQEAARSGLDGCEHGATLDQVRACRRFIILSTLR